MIKPFLTKPNINKPSSNLNQIINLNNQIQLLLNILQYIYSSTLLYITIHYNKYNETNSNKTNYDKTNPNKNT